MIVVKEVKTRKEKRDFINFPLNLYKNNPYFVPCIYMDEKNLFTKKNIYNETCDTKFWICYKDNKVVGRISAILQKAANNKRNQKVIRFTRFDSIDDQEVANLLFDKVFEYAASLNMDSVIGPLGYSDFEREGLLIKGFDELSTYEEQYNYPYYQKLIENYGFRKDVDWLERKIFPPKEKDPKIEKLIERIKLKHGLRVKKFKNINKVIKEHADDFFKVLDAAYKDLYQTVEFSKKQQKEIIKLFKLILSPKYIRIVVDKNDEVVAFGLAFPSIGKALQKSGGRLNLPTLLKLRKSIKDPEYIDLGIIGVIDEHRSTGASWVIFEEMFNMPDFKNVKHFETNLNLENNHEINNSWSRFESIEHKRRRSFIKDLKK